MSIAERRSREKEALRQSILDAAVEILASEGFEGLSLRRIADRIDYAPSTIYLYFRDKYEIVATICAETLDGLRADLERITSVCEDPVEGLRRGLRCYVDFAIAHPAHYLISFCQPMPELPPDHPTHGFEAGLRCFAVLQDGVRECIEAGRIRPLDINLASQSMWASLHGLSAILLTHYGKDPHFPWVERNALIENTIAQILRGVLVNPDEVPLPGLPPA